MSDRLSQPATFETLTNRYRITAELEAVTALRVGADKSLDTTSSNLPIMRDGRGQPFFPGSSLKGALRSGLESVLRAIDAKERSNLWACDLFEEPCADEKAWQDAECKRIKKEEGRKVNRRDIGPMPLELVQEKICTTCSLFGSTSLAGRIFVMDLPLAKEAATAELRDCVGINRDLGTAQGGIKYDFEALPPGTTFRLEILAENVDSDRLALVLQALELLNEGHILIGGFTSRGLGRVRLKNTKIEKTSAALLLSGRRYEALDYAGELKKGGERLGNLLGIGG